MKEYVVKRDKIFLSSYKKTKLTAKLMKIPIPFNILFLFTFLFFSCNSNFKTDSVKPEIYECKDYKLDIPIESVDAETNGKISGDTHFHSFSTDSEVFFSYYHFESEETAIKQLKENEKRAWQILRNSEIKDNTGNKIGGKMVITTSDNYVLLWTKGALLNSVSSESLAAIEKIEKDCNF